MFQQKLNKTVLDYITVDGTVYEFTASLHKSDSDHNLVILFPNLLPKIIRFGQMVNIPNFASGYASAWRAYCVATGAYDYM